MNQRRVISLIASLIALVLLWCIPSKFLGIENLDCIEQRVIAIFVFSALLWTTEAIPIWATSVLATVILLFTVSDSAPVFLRVNTEKMISYKSLLETFADPIIMLFLGGFVMAIAAKKCALDTNLAKSLLKPFGNKSQTVLLGIMIVTAFFSSFMSNTATAAIMFTIMTPVLICMKSDENERTCFALSAAFAANIGGMGTPVGTPPNAIVLQYLNEQMNLNIGFGKWAMVMMPMALILVVSAWFILIKLFPFESKKVEINLEGKFEKSWKAIVIYATFIVTVLLWMTDSLTGINISATAMLPIAVFASTGILTKNDLKDIPWDVLWLVAGGFALGIAIQETGLAKNIVSTIAANASGVNAITILVGAGLLCWGLSTFMSNTATAALLTPIAGALAIGMKAELYPIGGAVTLLLGIALAASMSMALPISTPPNAIAYSTGIIRQGQMAKAGIAIGFFGLVISYALIIILYKIFPSIGF